MNIFITVGTTPFDKLISYCDANLDVEQNEIKCQISNLAEYKPANFDSFEYTQDIVALYEWADVVVAHAGSGTLFQLLEMGKRCIFVPNNIHKDKHQNDLCKYVVDNDYAYVLYEYKQLNQLLEDIGSHRFNRYVKGSSEMASFITDILLSKIK